MIGYVMVGSNDLEKAAKFFDELLAVIGAKRTIEAERMIGWGTAPDQPMLAVCKPYDSRPATVGNGTMIALKVGSNELVDAVHRKAIELGGKDEGAPGPRNMPGLYIGYFRDLDGNKFDAYCWST
jgi:predicted lactoylglutathione lyase